MTTFQKSILALGVTASVAFAAVIRILRVNKSRGIARADMQLDTALAAVRRGETLPFDIDEWRSKAETAVDRDASSENSRASAR